MQVKKQVVDRLMGEVSYKGDVYQNALAIAYTFVNRAKATGTNLDSVTSVKSQVNAQKPAKGSEKYRATVEKAMNDAASGRVADPVDGSTFYARESAWDGMVSKLSGPKELDKVTTIGEHIFGKDPHNRPIKTADGVKKVNPMNINTPVPTAKPTAHPTPANTLPTTVTKDPSSPFGIELARATPFSKIANQTLNFSTPKRALDKGISEAAALRYQTPESILSARRAFDALGIDPAINNGFREGPLSPTRPTGADYNKMAGGKSGSRHQVGDAFDISTTGMSIGERAALVDTLISEGFNGIGYGPNMVHADMRPTAARWGYKQYKNEKNWPSQIKGVVDRRGLNDGVDPSLINRDPSMLAISTTPTPRPTPVLRPDAQQDELAALDGANNTELARLAGNSVNAPADSVYMHEPNVSDEENITRGIMQAIQRGNPNIPKPTQKPPPSGLFQGATNIPSQPAPVPSGPSIFMSNRAAGLPTQQSSSPAINVGDGYSGPLPEINAYNNNVPPTPSGRPNPSYQRGLFPDQSTQRPNVADFWSTPSDLSDGFAKSRSDLGMSNYNPQDAYQQYGDSRNAGIAQSQNASDRINRGFASLPSHGSSYVDNAPASRSGYQGGGSKPGYTSSQFSGPDKTTDRVGQSPQSSYNRAPQGYTSSQFSGRNNAPSEPQFINKTISQRVPKSPAGGMTLDQASHFAYGPTAVIDGLRSAPIPTAKPAQEYDIVTKQIQVANPNYKPAPAPQPMMAAPMPTPKPEEAPGFFGSIAKAMGGMFNPAGTAGGLIGGALGGPLGSIAGNLAGRGISNVIQNNPTVGNRGTTNSTSTGNNSGGPYAGQSWRNTSSGGTRAFNPSSRQYEDIGGSNAGNRSDSQSTGKIVCTAMNKRYGFGGFRNAIWLKYAADNLTPFHERGYHALFQPLVNYGFGGDGKARQMVRKALEHIARERTADLWAEMRKTKRRALGRSYRAILEPVCWLVGKFTKK